MSAMNHEQWQLYLKRWKEKTMHTEEDLRDYREDKMKDPKPTSFWTDIRSFLRDTLGTVWVGTCVSAYTSMVFVFKCLTWPVWGPLLMAYIVGRERQGKPWDTGHGGDGPYPIVGGRDDGGVMASGVCAVMVDLAALVIFITIVVQGIQ